MHSPPRRRLPLAIAVIVASISCSLLPSGTAAGAKAPAWHEVASMRTASSDTFTNGAGDYRTRLYSGPTNYRSGRVWKRIDSSLVADGKASSGFENAANSFRVRLKRSLRGSYLHFEAPQGRASFSVSLQGATGARALKKGRNGLSYEEARYQADLDYQVTPDGLKETIELRDRRAPLSYVFELVPGKGEQLRAVRQGDGSVRFFGRGASKPAFSILAPTVTDSLAETEGAPPAKGMSSMSVQRQKDGRFRLELSIDRKWLSDPARTFPVYLDPSYSTSVYDNTDGFYNYGSGQNVGPDMKDHLELGPRPYVGNGDAYDIVINYGLSNGLSPIPRGAQVDGDVSAGLHLRGCRQSLTNYNCPASSGVIMRALNSPGWSPATPWKDISYGSTVLASRYFSASYPVSGGNWVTLLDNSGNLSDEIQNLLDGDTQYGFLFEAVSSSGPSFSFDSYRDCPTAPSSCAPYLQVNWHSVAPSSVDQPEIDGDTSDAGQTLSVVRGDSNGTWPLSYGYQWQRCNEGGGGCSDIPGATGTQYVLTLADVGSTIRVRETVSNAVGSSSATSDTTDVVGTAPSNDDPPTISGISSGSGVPKDGDVLTATTGTWSGSAVHGGHPGFRYDYQWYRCDPSGDTCDPVGSDASTYKLTSQDVGHAIEVEVTASNDVGSDSATSDPTEVVEDPPASISPPTISGISAASGVPGDGDELTATTGSWSGSAVYDGGDGFGFDYQWLRCDSAGTNCSSISGATDSNFDLTADDVGHTFEVEVTASNDVGSASATSHPTGVVEEPPSNDSPPTVSGTARDGEKLTTATGTWSGSAVYEGNPGFHFDYQWRRCDSSGGNCADIPGATDASYDLTPDDVGSTIEVEVTASNDVGSAVAQSDPTGVVEAIPPANTSPPTISGTAEDGEKLTATTGTWSGSAFYEGSPGFHFDFQWRRCDLAGASCTDISGATDSSYVLAPGDVGSTIELQVTATNSASSATATSNPTDLVVAAPPSNIDRPAISGTAEDEQTLTGSSGTWSGTDPSFTYQWLRCDSACNPISGATDSSYVLTHGDVGSRIELQVTAENSVSSATATSDETDVVVAAPLSNIDPPKITGTVKDGQTLTGTNGTWDGTPPSTYAYQWRLCDSDGANCEDIDGATANSYTVKTGDIGSTIRLRVTATNSVGSATAESAATSESEATEPSSSSLPTITGTPTDGQTLTGSRGSWDGTPPIDYVYHWQRCDSGGAGCSNISGAYVTTYVLTSADVGHAIRLQVTASNAAGSASAQSTATDPVAAIKPTNTTPPSISGTPNVGEKLTASNGSWSGSTPISFSYQWLRCDTSGSGCSSISGAANSTYTVGSADQGHELEVSVTGTNAGGSDTGTSSAVAVLQASPSTSVSGISLELIASPAVVSPGDTVTYQLKATNGTSSDRLLDHLSLDLPSSFSYTQSSIQGGPSVSPAVSGGTLEWSGLIDLPAGGSKTITVDSGSAISPGTYYGSATATSKELTIDPLTRAAPVQVLSGLAVSVSAGSDMASPGDHVKYTIAMANGTGSSISFDQVSDRLPDGFKYIPGTTTGALSGDPSTNGTSLVWSVNRQLGSGEKTTISFDASTSTSGTGVSHQVEVEKSGASRGSGEGAGVDVASNKALALKYRPFVMFDASEPWRPLNVDMFLHERYDNRNGESHVMCDRASGLCSYDALLLNSNDGVDKCTVKGQWRSCTPASAIRVLMEGQDDKPEDKYFHHDLRIIEDRNTPGMETCYNETSQRLCDYNRGPGSAIYYHFTNDTQGTNYLDYWFFYRYNSPHWGGIDDHEGDWEHMIVGTGIPKSHDCRPGIRWVGYSAHGTLYKYDCHVLLWSGDTRVSNESNEATSQQTHVDTYVANGTHAMYPRPCFGSGDSCNQNTDQGWGPFTKTIEGGFDGRAPWGRNGKKQCLKGSPCVLPILDKTLELDGERVYTPKYPYWAYWNGYWGASGDSPETPYWQNYASPIDNAFENPWLSGYSTECPRTVFDDGSPKCTNTGTPEKVKVEMPNVIRKAWTSEKVKPDARTKLTDKKYGYRFVVTEKTKSSLDVPNNHVIKTKPKARTPLFKGDPVTVWVSKGPPPVTVPDVTGKTLNNAKATLKSDKYRLKIKEVDRVYDLNVKKGHVIKTDPAKNWPAHMLDPVTIWVSKGPKPVKMPDVKNWAWDTEWFENCSMSIGLKHPDAKTMLTNNSCGYDFGVTKKTDYSLKIANNYVIKTKPAANASTHQGASVTVWVSKGPEPVTVPDVTREALNKAKKKLKSDKYKFDIKDVNYSYDTDIGSGKVIKTSPAKNNPAHKGDSISIWVSKGKKPKK